MGRHYNAEDRRLHAVVGANMRTRRFKLKIKSKDAAEYVGAEPTTYSNWEFGIGTPSLRALQRLADLYSCKIDAFFDMEVDFDAVLSKRRVDLGSGKRPRRIYRTGDSAVADNPKRDDEEESGLQVDDPVRSNAG